METAIIIVLAFMLLIAVIILVDINFNIKRSNIRIQVSASLVDKSKKEIERLKNKNAAFKIEIDQQHTIFSNENHALKSTIKFKDSKINELETKYKSSLQKINERDEKIRDRDIEIMALTADSNHFNKAYIGLDNEVNNLQNLIDEKDAIIKLRDSEINKYHKCNKQIAEELIKKNNVIEDAWNTIRELEKTKNQYSARVYELHGEKDFAIHQSKSAIKLCDQMSKMFKLMNSELESIESQLLSKLKP